MHHFYANTLWCIFIYVHIHYHAYSFLNIFISMHIHIPMHIHILTSPCLYKLLPKPFDRQTYTDRERTKEVRYTHTTTEDTTGPNTDYT